MLEPFKVQRLSASGGTHGAPELGATASTDRCCEVNCVTVAKAREWLPGKWKGMAAELSLAPP